MPVSSAIDAPPDSRPLALALTGGGARAAYQVGLLRCLARHMPEMSIPIITGVSAGAINAVHLAAHRGSLSQAADDLTELWASLTPDQVFRVGPLALSRNLARWGFRLISGGGAAPRVKSFLDTSPLRTLLKQELRTIDGEIPGIAENLERGRLSAFALSTLNYSTGQTVTWVQGSDIVGWERPQRRGMKTRVSVEHVMASSALPMVFPAVRLGDSWYGDGGIRLTTPLAPAIHLGARRILAVSTRYAKDFDEFDQPTIRGYPPPAQILGTLLNSIFLDLVDQDANRLERVNGLLKKLPEEQHGNLKPVDLLVLRPSQDLGKLAAEYEVELPGAFRFLTRGLGTRETKSPDFLSLLMFQPDYLKRIIDIGETDAEAKLDELKALLA